MKRIFSFGLRFFCLLIRVASIYLELISALAEFVKHGNPITVGIFKSAWVLRRYADQLYPIEHS